MLACRGLKKPTNPWNKEMESFTGMSEALVKPISEDVRLFVVEVNPKFLTTLKYKFSKQEYLEVAALPFSF